MADSSSVQLYFVEETTWGEIPAGPPTLNEFRFTNESLNQTTDTQISEEIRSDRQVSDIIRVAVSASGEVGLELSYGSHDPLLAGALYDDWSTPVTFTDTVVFSNLSPEAGQMALGSPIPSPNPLLNVVVGQFLRISETTLSPTNTGFYKVTAVDAVNGTITFDRIFPNTGSAAATVYGEFIRNSTTRKSFTLEKWYSDIVVTTDSPNTGVYQYFTGMRVGSVSLTIAPGAIINGSFTFEGKQAFSSGVTVGDGSPVAVSANDVMNAVDNITEIRINGQESTQCLFTSVEFTVENNLRAQPCIGSLANSGIGLGRTNVSGTIEAYLINREFFDRYLNFETVSMSFRAVLGGNSYVFDFPAIKFTTGEASTPGNDQDVLAVVEFQAKRDPVSGFMVAINRFPL